MKLTKAHIALLATIIIGAPVMWATTTVAAPQEGTELSRDARNALIAGSWRYKKASVQASGSTIIGKLGKPIATGKLRKKLDKSFKKLKVNKHWTALDLNLDGTWTMTVKGVTMGGRYDYEPGNHRLTLRWHGIPVHTRAERRGKSLHLLFDADPLLTIMGWIAGISHSEALKALPFVNENYRDVMMGFELRKR